MSKDYSGPAFPNKYQSDSKGNRVCSASAGMTLRQYYAAKAMQGICGGYAGVSEPLPQAVVAEIVRRSFLLADTMIEAEGWR